VCDVAAREISDAHSAANLNTFINTIFTCIYKIYNLCKVKQKFKIQNSKQKYICAVFRYLMNGWLWTRFLFIQAHRREIIEPILQSF